MRNHSGSGWSVTIVREREQEVAMIFDRYFLSKNILRD